MCGQIVESKMKTNILDMGNELQKVKDGMDNSAHFLAAGLIVSWVVWMYCNWSPGWLVSTDEPRAY